MALSAAERSRRYRERHPERERARKRRWHAGFVATPEGRLQANLWTRKHVAKREGIPFAVELADVIPDGPPTHCPVLGFQLNYSGVNSDESPSFDRIDPEGGYVPGNVACISLRANRIKRTFTADQLRERLAGMAYGGTTARGVTDDEIAQVLRYIEDNKA